MVHSSTEVILLNEAYTNLLVIDDLIGRLFVKLVSHPTM